MQTFFSELATKGPLFIDGTMFYFVAPYDKEQNYLKFSNSSGRLGLTSIGDFSEIFRFYKHLKRDDIYKLKREFVHDHAGGILLDKETRDQIVGQRKIISFIVEELMPYLNGHKEDVKELFGEEVETLKDGKNVGDADVIAGLERLKTNLKNERRDVLDLNLSLRRNLPNRLLTLGEKVYNLTIAQKKWDIELFLDNKTAGYHNIAPLGNVKEIDNRFFKVINSVFELEAIDEFGDYLKEIYKERLNARKNLDDILKYGEYSEGDVGFLKLNGSILVYQIIPPFAMLDPRPTNDGICYEFPKCRVGCGIYLEGDKISLNEPVLFESFWHPFVRDEKLEFQHLCGGRVTSRQNFKSGVEWVAKVLDDAKNLVMHGLTPKSIKDHGGDKKHGGAYFGTRLDEKIGSRKITLKEALNKGLLITNKWGWE
ncbi:MAG: hypothetical protein AABY22_00905 [Nanoarchaeota archaeon]